MNRPQLLQPPVYVADVADGMEPRPLYPEARQPSCSAEGRWIAMSMVRREDRWSSEYGRIRVVDRVTGTEIWPTR